MKLLIVLALAALCVGLVCASLLPSSGCISCICGVESNGGKPGCGRVSGDKKCGEGCVWDVGSCSCGPYQIKQPYFTDCSKFTTLTINDWRQCSTDESCATQCVLAYVEHYGKSCTHKTNITCEEYGGVHNGGPRGCDSPKTQAYRNKIKSCCEKTSCQSTKEL